MERRFRTRLGELLKDAEVPASVLRGVIPRLESFLQPFAQSLLWPEQRANAKQYIAGLLFAREAGRRPREGGSRPDGR
jgi:hypothetical protein